MMCYFLNRFLNEQERFKMLGEKMEFDDNPDNDTPENDQGESKRAPASNQGVSVDINVGTGDPGASGAGGSSDAGGEAGGASQGGGSTGEAGGASSGGGSGN